ncbi:MAG: hypothetical protein K2K08_02255, partial [Paramuribaculum sp.]|nr:hypothetical protein [Paramuribaculum sp.]
MKLYHLITAMGVAIATLTSCGSSGSSSDNCWIFGEVPGIYADYQAQRDKIEDSAKKSESDY